MTEQEKIEKVARALCADAGSKCECKVPCPPCMQDAKTSFAVLRPIIREEALEEAAKEALDHVVKDDGDDGDYFAGYNAAVSNITASLRALKAKP